jgi:hypothetical protein
MDDDEAQTKKIVEQFIFYQEEITIQFANFLNNGRFTMWGNSWVDPYNKKDKEGQWLFYTTKELYDIFKRERSETVA